MPLVVRTRLLQNGLTALLWAADLGHLEVVQLLLKMKADIQAVDAVSATCV